MNAAPFPGFSDEDFVLFKYFESVVVPGSLTHEPVAVPAPAPASIPMSAALAARCAAILPEVIETPAGFSAFVTGDPLSSASSAPVATSYDDLHARLARLQAYSKAIAVEAQLHDLYRRCDVLQKVDYIEAAVVSGSVSEARRDNLRVNATPFLDAGSSAPASPSAECAKDPDPSSPS